MNRPAWFVAGLLAMIAGLMIAHLDMLRMGVRECDDLWKLQLEQAKRLAAKSDRQANITPANSECSNVEDDYSKTADQYLTVILSLLGGAGIAAGSAAVQRPGPTTPQEGTPQPPATPPGRDSPSD